jgi:hypothetical protein
MTPKLLALTTALILISLSALNAIADGAKPGQSDTPCAGTSQQKSADDKGAAPDAGPSPKSVDTSVTGH